MQVLFPGNLFSLIIKTYPSKSEIFSVCNSEASGVKVGVNDGGGYGVAVRRSVASSGIGFVGAGIGTGIGVGTTVSILGFFGRRVGSGLTLRIGIDSSGASMALSWASRASTVASMALSWASRATTVASISGVGTSTAVASILGVGSAGTGVTEEQASAKVPISTARTTVSLIHLLRNYRSITINHHTTTFLMLLAILH
jgi:hypothetical protein